MINVRFRRAFRDEPGATAIPKIQGPSLVEQIVASVRPVISEDGGSKPEEDAVPSSTPAEKLNTAANVDVPLGTSSRTLEGMATELLRPMLREWLDENLPSAIDRMVRQEIEKLVRRTEDRQSSAQTRYRS
jgi:cell pole-organizing protein PopZ